MITRPGLSFTILSFTTIYLKYMNLLILLICDISIHYFPSVPKKPKTQHYVK